MKAGRQELYEGRDGGHGVPAGERIHELHLPAVAAIGVLVAREQLERLAAAGIGIVEDRRGPAEGRRSAERGETIAEASAGGAFASDHGLHFFRIDLVELRAEELDDADVEAVHPYHRLAPRVAVIVEGPRRRDDEIAWVHGRALAIDGGVGAGALDDEAQRRLAV